MVIATTSCILDPSMKKTSMGIMMSSRRLLDAMDFTAFPLHSEKQA